jgi:CubicO group peptidase (beta-lactamase class C family)
MLRRGLLIGGTTLVVLAVFTPGPNGSARAGGAPGLPETPAGKRLAGWLAAYNTNKADVIRRFVEEQYVKSDKSATDRRLEVFSRVFEDNGRLEVVRVEKSTDSQVVVLTRSPRTESWVRLDCTVAAEAPRAIARVAIERAEAPAEPGRGKLTDAEIVRQLDAYVDKLASENLFSGAVLFARGGKPLYLKARGLASKAFNVPNRVDTKFNLGSMNKMFTAVAIAQLAEKGKLDFSDPLIKHLPDYPNKEVARKVTLHHLLTHTSGIGDYFNDKYRETSKDRFRAIRDYFPLFTEAPLSFEPGKEFRYSNAGFMVLGAVIEKVSGEDYFEYVREHIYKPAGMLNTDAFEMDRDTPNLAIGYTAQGDASGRKDGKMRNNLFLHVVKGGPAGGGFSTVEDLLRFDVALRAHRLVGQKYTDILLTGKVPTGRRGEYGYGFFVEDHHGTRIAGHGGGFPGINSALDMYLDNGCTVAVMANYDPPAAQRVADKLRALITQE